VSEGLVDERVIHELVLPRRRGGGPWYRCPESRFLTREELRRLLAAIPDQWRPLFDLLALTGLRISEAIGLRWCDLDLDRQVSRLHVRQAIVRGIVGAPKSRHGIRSLPISSDLAQRLTERRPTGARPADLVFTRADGQWLRPEYLRRYVLRPAVARAGIAPLGLHAPRHTCAALLVAKGRSALQLQHWMATIPLPTRSRATVTSSTVGWVPRCDLTTS
jgi:integrase